MRHVHWPGDGRGPRKVFVNGYEVERCVWANTKAGVVEYVPGSAKVKRPEGDRVYTRFLRGTVTVEFVSAV